MILHTFRRIALAHDLLPAEASSPPPAGWTAHPVTEPHSEPAELPGCPRVAADQPD